MQTEFERNNPFMPLSKTQTSVLTDPSLYVDRDLSLLRFQHRVLEEAREGRNPLLERLKFLAILGSNMDEFFMVRISRIRHKLEERLRGGSPGAWGSPNELTAIHRHATDLYGIALKCLHEDLLPRLNKAGIHVLDYDQLGRNQKKEADSYFEQSIYPVLTPLAIGAGHPFPHISSQSLNLAVLVRDSKGEKRLAHLEVPDRLERLLPLSSLPTGDRQGGKVERRYVFTWLEQVIRAHVAELFPGQAILGVYAFRIVRDAGPQIEDLDADELPEVMQETILQQAVHRREFAPVVQLALERGTPPGVRQFLASSLGANPSDIYMLESPLGLGSLWALYDGIDRPDLKYPVYRPASWRILAHATESTNIFELICNQKILLHHPYDSFSLVVDFLNTAARDPDVLAIKQTLYRVGSSSPVVKALRDASRRGKDVTAFVELKATFDEESNIGWALMLEQAGVHVVYGVPGLKTHGKVGLVVRKEGKNINRYVHLATGNYNVLTSKTYEDLGIFSCDDALGADVSDLFNYLTGYSEKHSYRKLLVAPFDLRRRLEALIRREMQHAAQGKSAHLIFKVNSLVDRAIIALLYEASQAGVRIDLMVRGMCCLRPHVRGVSDHINVTSIVGRYLEHSRIFYFLNGGKEELYLGSADLMERNLDQRVEVVFPVEDQRHVRYVRDHILELYLRDNQLAWSMQSDGKYRRKTPRLLEPIVDVQGMLMRARQKTS
jgi:polyphosphate kinase